MRKTAGRANRKLRQRAMSSNLLIELGDAAFTEVLRYFVTLLMVGGPADGPPMQDRTDVAPTPTDTPTFNKKQFTFSVPPDAEPEIGRAHV